MSVFLNFLFDAGWVSVFAFLILIGAAAFYWSWFRPTAVAVQMSLQRVESDLKRSSDQPWSQIRSAVIPPVGCDAAVAESWRQTAARAAEIPKDDQSVDVLFGEPRDLWNARTLLSHRLNLKLVEAVPNLLVGIGLFFTFLFLTLALTATTGALTPGAPDGAKVQVSPTTDPDAPSAGMPDPLDPQQALARATASTANAAKTEEAIRDLLHFAGAKFLTSLAGLLASIAWAVCMHRRLRAVDESCHRVLKALEKVLPFDGAERHLKWERERAEVVASHSEEMLREAREQTGVLKRFETDMAVSLANAIAPQMQSMSDQLVNAINGLSDRLSAMNQDALQQMLDDFSGTLREATQSEMTGLREALTTLTTQLDGAGRTIGDNAGRVAKELDLVGERLLTSSEQVAQRLVSGAEHLDKASTSLKLVMNDLDVTIADAVQAGRAGVTSFRTELGQVEQTLGQLATISGTLGEASRSIEGTSRSIAVASESMGALSRELGALGAEQRQMVQMIEQQAPKASAALQQVTGVFEEAAKRTSSILTHAAEQTRQTMESTATTLSKTVASINEGVSVYSQDVAKLHHSMDGALAKAVGSFDKGVNDLAETVEELSEALENHRKVSQ